ncbi:MAG: gluconate 2-dehydrogenase subunit 3 family protein [Gemmatimonadaceae bacterium]|nr:gluconate 2-dehydrogenase subunit 3 family protein [Gemmatimonadaceae bacterium]
MRDDEQMPEAPETPEVAPAPENVKRRDALKSLAAAASLPILASLPGSEAEAQQAAPKPAAAAAPQAKADPNAWRGPRGDAWDPDLIKPKKDWPRKLNATEIATLAALADMIIPADAKSPSASAVGAHHYINEHVSAPGENYARDLVRVRGGVSWLNLESQKRFERPFVRLTAAQKTAICDDICYTPKAKPEFQAAARFFSLVRNLVATGFYTTDAGMKDIGYIGNKPMAKWDMPPAAVLKQLGLD